MLYHGVTRNIQWRYVHIVIMTCCEEKQWFCTSYHGEENVDYR